MAHQGAVAAHGSANVRTPRRCGISGSTAERGVG